MTVATSSNGSGVLSTILSEVNIILDVINILKKKPLD